MVSVDWQHPKMTPIRLPARMRVCLCDVCLTKLYCFISSDRIKREWLEWILPAGVYSEAEQGDQGFLEDVEYKICDQGRLRLDRNSGKCPQLATPNPTHH